MADNKVKDLRLNQLLPDVKLRSAEIIILASDRKSQRSGFIAVTERFLK